MNVVGTVQMEAQAKPNGHAASTLLSRRPCASRGAGGFMQTWSEDGNNRMSRQELHGALRISQAGDVSELEADRIADQVLRMLKSGPQMSRSQAAAVRSKPAQGSRTGAVPAIVHEVISSPGQPLDKESRAFFEPRFSHDFGKVRVHADMRAAESAQAVHARAFAVGNHIVFGTGAVASPSLSARRLLAHELTHIVQQKGNGLGRALQRTPDSSSEPEQSSVSVSLASGVAATHEIVIDGESFNLLVMTFQPAPEDPAWRYRDTAGEYVGSYPNLANGLWALIVRPGDGVLCQTGGNCLGWALGTYGLIDPPDQVWGLVQEYLGSIGRSVRGGQSAQETYLKQTAKEKIPAAAIWDYFMATRFQATPAETDGEANLALYGRGFGGPMDGPSHIAFRTAGGELWVSKPSPSRFPLVHESAAQMSGGQTGDIVRLYTGAAGSRSHISMRPQNAGGQ